MVVVLISARQLTSNEIARDGRFWPPDFGRVMTPLRRVILGCLGIALLLSSEACSPLSAQDVVSREYEIKAGVISLLGKFVTWPDKVAPNRDRPLTIGVLGQDPFLEGGVNQLDQTVAAEQAKGRLIVVRRFDSAKNYQPCHILYVSDLAAPNSDEQEFKDRLEAAVKLTKDKPVLLTGAAPGLPAWGFSANMLFDRANNRIRLELNPDAANRHELKLAPQLLRLPVVQIIRDKN